MKTFFKLSLIFLFALAACAPGRSRAACNEGLCIDITFVEPVEAGIPVEFIIKATSDVETDEVSVSISLDPGIDFQDLQSQPEQGQLSYQDAQMAAWVVNLRPGEEYTFSGHLVFEQPLSYGVSHYGGVIAITKMLSIHDARKSFSIFLDSTGHKLSEEEAERLLQTPWPLPTIDPALFLTETARPTKTATSTPVPTPTIFDYPPPYPAPLEHAGSEGAQKGFEMDTSTPEAYPVPKKIAEWIIRSLGIKMRRG